MLQASHLTTAHTLINSFIGNLVLQKHQEMPTAQTFAPSSPTTRKGITIAQVLVAFLRFLPEINCMKVKQPMAATNYMPSSHLQMFQPFHSMWTKPPLDNIDFQKMVLEDIELLEIL